MKKFFIYALALVVFFVGGWLLINKHKKPVRTAEIVPEVQTDTNREELMQDLANRDDKDMYKFFRGYLEGVIENGYCYSAWRPHGGFWELGCFGTKRECDADFTEMVDIVGKDGVAPANCVKPEFVSAWCIDKIKNGYKRHFDDFDETSYNDALSMVCAKTKAKCESVKKYQKAENPSGCANIQVLSIPNETEYYMWSDKDIDLLIKRNEKNKDK